MSDKFLLHYHVSNNGDGSASSRFHRTAEDAEAADEAQNDSGDGWGESSAGVVELEIQDGKIVRKTHEWDGKKHKVVFIPLEEI